MEIPMENLSSKEVYAGSEIKVLIQAPPGDQV